MFDAAFRTAHTHLDIVHLGAVVRAHREPENVLLPELGADGSAQVFEVIAVEDSQVAASSGPGELGELRFLRPESRLIPPHWSPSGEVQHVNRDSGASHDAASGFRF